MPIADCRRALVPPRPCGVPHCAAAGGWQHEAFQIALKSGLGPAPARRSGEGEPPSAGWRRPMPSGQAPSLTLATAVT